MESLSGDEKEAVCLQHHSWSSGRFCHRNYKGVPFPRGISSSMAGTSSTVRRSTGRQNWNLWVFTGLAWGYLGVTNRQDVAQNLRILKLMRASRRTRVSFRSAPKSVSAIRRRGGDMYGKGKDDGGYVLDDVLKKSRARR